jgi:hypothetical protein
MFSPWRVVVLPVRTHPLVLRHQPLEAPMASTVEVPLQLKVVESVTGVTDAMSMENNGNGAGFVIVSEVVG